MAWLGLRQRILIHILTLIISTKLHPVQTAVLKPGRNENDFFQEYL